MVESIACIEWIRRNIFDVAGSNTGSEGIGKYQKRWKGEYMRRRRAVMTAEQRRLQRTRNVQVNRST